MSPLGVLTAVLVGLSLGLLGGGGSILTVPIFVYVFGLEAKTAIATSLPVVGTVSLAGALTHWRAGNVQLGTAALFGLTAMLGAFAGARLATLLDGEVQLTILAAVILSAAIAMFRRRDGEAHPLVTAGSTRALVLLLAVALAVGLLTGVVGIGGGFLIVPALVLVARVPMKLAVGTSLLVIAMNSASGLAGYLGRVAIPWGFAATFTGVAILGIVAGTALVRFVSQAHLRRGFAVFLLAVGVFTLYQNRGAFDRGSSRPAAAPSPTR